VLTIESSRFRFAQPSRVITVSDSIAGLDWVAEPQK